MFWGVLDAKRIVTKVSELQAGGLGARSNVSIRLNMNETKKEHFWQQYFLRDG